MRYFVKPPADFYRSERSSSCENVYYEKWVQEGQGDDASYPTYTEYNYLGSGLAARIKAQHFEVALRLSRVCFGAETHVIDFGCADGVFLPSLAEHFGTVCGVEQHRPFARVSQGLVQAAGLDNVSVLCNADIDLDDLGKHIPDREYRALFLLEVIEHVGDKEALYETKLEFLGKLFGLLASGGVVVLSVPRMVGLSFLAQRMGFAVLGIQRETMSMSQLLRASFLCDTAELEREWDSSKHLGFNDRLLERHIERGGFRIEARKNLLFQKVFVISRPSG